MSPDVVQASFQVAYDFPVVFTRDAFDPANPALRDVLSLREPSRRHRVACFVDAGLASSIPALTRRMAAYAASHADALELAGEVVLVPSGEACKNDAGLVDRLLEALAVRAIDRHSYVLVAGGGAVLDVVGFAAAIFHRGVRLVRLPSTVLAQDDSGVGVKNAINWRGRKNLVGCFAPPWAVINDAAFLDALPSAQRRAGMAEAVKVALIRDADFLRSLERDADALAAGDARALGELVRRSSSLHLAQIARGGDPFERGSGRPLDFGHWCAHQLERLTRHALSHGEAVAIGVALDTRCSVRTGLLAEGEDLRVHALLERLGFTPWHDALSLRDAAGRLRVLDGIAEFREHLGGELTLTLLAAPGRGVEVHALADDVVEDAVAWLAERAGVAVPFAASALVD